MAITSPSIYIQFRYMEKFKQNKRHLRGDFFFIWHFSYQPERGRSTLGRSCDYGMRKLKRILFKYSKWREPFRGKCTLTGLSEINVYKWVHTYIAFISIALTSSSFLTYCSTSRCNYLIIRDSLRKLPIRSQPLRRKLPIDTLICLCFCNWFHLDGNYKIVIGIACTQRNIYGY